MRTWIILIVDMIDRFVLVLSVILATALSLPVNDQKEQTCGYAACHPVNPDKFTVHLVPHSHDDVGWLKTVDQYYYGARSSIQKAGVQYIIQSYLEALKQNPDRRFIQVETAYFWKWWKQQTEKSQQEYKDLVNRGQIEIINGGWSMNDEAATNYQSTIDQFTLGLNVIEDSLGKCGRPKVGWQIDPFGHSREMASLYAQFGFEGFFSGRIHFADKDLRLDDKNLDFLWQGSANLVNTTIFGNVLVDFYISPTDFCFDIECDSEPINDDPDSFDYNLDSRVKDFEVFVRQKKDFVKTNNLLVPMGGDFQYQAAEVNFVNMDKLIAGFRERVNDIDIIYSTPACYMKAVNEQINLRNIKFTVKTDDFFPHASDQHSYWTGYFSSRPTSKRLERTGNNILQAAKQLATFASLRNITYGHNLEKLMDAMGIMQHHDAITGTEKQHVARDYARLVNRAIRKAEENLGSVIGSLLSKGPKPINLNLKTCLLANITVCETSQWNNFSVIVYNPYNHALNYTVTVPVAAGRNYSIVGPTGSIRFFTSASIINFTYAEEYIPPSNTEIRFVASDLPALGVNYYHFSSRAKPSVTDEVQNVEVNLKDIPKTEDGHYKIGSDEANLFINSETHLLSGVTLNDVTLPLEQNFYFYHSAVGDNLAPSHRSSGAYIFRPNGTAQRITDTVESLSILRTIDDIVVHQKFNKWLTQIIKINFANPEHIEFDWVVGPIDIADDAGKEVVTRFILPEGFSTEGSFYTDSNGREMLYRLKDFKPDYNFSRADEPISSNYYPVTSKITVKDETKQVQLSVLNDRAQGGTHLQDDDGRSFVELMIHRRMLNDDAFGVGEALNEMEYDGRGLTARGSHYLVVGSSDPSVKNRNGMSTTAQERHLAQTLLKAPWVLVSNYSDANFQKKINFKYSALNKTLPKNVNLLTLERWKNNSYLLRLEHILEKGEDVELSAPVQVDLNNMIANLTIHSVRETTLAANEWLDEFNGEERLNWRTDDGSITNIVKTAKPIKNFTVTLVPMQIRTFVINAS